MLLEDGTRLDGVAVGAPGHAVGEVVFNTAMTGYQEAVTDPSYGGQIITFTYPLIGNYGVVRRRPSSRTASHARAVIMREARKRAARRARAGWLDWLAAEGVPGDRRRRHARARAPHPRPRRDARRGLPGRAAASDEARDADRRRALDGGPRPRRARSRPAEPIVLGADAGRAEGGRARHRHQALDRRAT